MKAREIMTVTVATVRPDTLVGAAAAKLSELRVASLPVVDDDDRVVGIVSEMDLIRDRMPKDDRFDSSRAEPRKADPAREVRDVMTSSVLCLGADAETADLAELMSGSDVRAVPIVDGSRLVGIASRRDLLRTLTRDDASIRQEVLGRVTQYTGDDERWSVEVENGVATIRGRFTETVRQAIVMQLARTVPGVLRVRLEPQPRPD